jgi:hypothetical protein
VNVRIGRVVVRNGRLAPNDGPALGRLIGANLKQLLSRDSAPVETRNVSATQVNAGPHPEGSNLAGIVARALYRSIRQKS